MVASEGSLGVTAGGVAALSFFEFAMTMNGDCRNNLKFFDTKILIEIDLSGTEILHILLSTDSEGVCRNVPGVYARRNLKLC
jgi:hypothetical protein